MDGVLEVIAHPAKERLLLVKHAETAKVFIITYRTKESKVRCPKQFVAQDSSKAMLYYHSRFGDYRK